MKITEACDIQEYLIGGFMEYGHAQDYADILPEKMFGHYATLFAYLSKNGNSKTPDYFKACNAIGNDYAIAASERADVSFVSGRDKYVTDLLDYYVTESLSKGKTPMELLEDTKDIYVKLALLKSQNTGGFTGIDSLCSSLWEEVSNAAVYGELPKGYKTGIPFVDRYTGGLIKGRTIRLSGYANTGKSAISYAVCNSALKHGAKVLYFSLEIPKEDLRDRLVSNFYEIPMWKFEQKKELSDLDLTYYANLPLSVSCDVFTMSEVEKLVASVKPDVVFIDYVQLLKGEGTGEYEQMNDIARRIRKMTADNDVAVFDLSQIPNEGKKYVKGGVIPAKGSGELVSAANIVLVLEESKKEGILNLHLAKNRHGTKGKCYEISPDFGIAKFTEIREADDKNF